ncbi:hypothetical protein [Rivibacter subsaxonicus]|uniref:Uncharacterized protein n=1 Tax=Rivibacter subsaxonicus TaxID=457575 RepID=A0A4Q7V7D7_9BURK|nr:hypothetical protein [Rivibacter subsaxonicus]RZT92561.1 hypothetical protein EV670_3539 [Rivibacter subsaxonicus]
MMRKEWAFDYAAGTLAEAASKKLAFHHERLEFWKQSKDETMTTIRSEGLEIDEKLALGYRSPKSADWERGAKVVVRNDLRDRLDECLSKLSHHSDLIQQYDGWLQALLANPQARMQLDIEDWLFFFGKH